MKGWCVSIPCRNLRTERVLPDERGSEKLLRRSQMPCRMLNRRQPSSNRDMSGHDDIITRRVTIAGVEYVTIRDTVEHAIVTLFSVGVY